MKRELTIIIIIFTSILVSGMAQGTGRIAILSGIDQYAKDSQIQPLRSAALDAQKFSRILSQNGYECKTFLNEEATKERLTEAFIEIEQQTGQTGELDVFLCYFSGRGTRIRDDIQADEIQDNFDECILPSDAISGNTRSYIRDDALARWLSAIKAKQIILILDCVFWGDEADADVKGFGKLSEDPTLDGVEIADGLPQDAIILSAALPGAPTKDGVFTTNLLKACFTEDADKNGDRVISFAEAYQFARQQLQGQQQPRLVASKGADIPLAPLPPLSRLGVDSNPRGAEILIYAGSKPATPDSQGQAAFTLLPLSETQHTPSQVQLKHGKYQVKAQKPGYLIPEAKDVEITEYNTLYSVEPFQLKPITVVGKTNLINMVGEATSAEDVVFTLHVKQGDEEVHQQNLSADGRFQFKPEVKRWLSVGSKYELYVTGQPVLNVKPASFTYDGYKDISAAITVTLDQIPPTLSPNGIVLQSKRLVVGEELTGSVKATDDGLGLAKTIELQLQPPDGKKSVSIPTSQISFQTPDTYQFRYTLPETVVGEWRVTALNLSDKAGNTSHFSDAKLKTKFLVFDSRFALGKDYFDAKDYLQALEQFKQVLTESENAQIRDDAHYLTALAHYQQGDLAKGLRNFQQVENKIKYLGDSRPKETPQMPRQMVNKIWGQLLDDLDAHKKDTAYITLLAATAEDLGRSYEAKVYREYIKWLAKK